MKRIGYWIRDYFHAGKKFAAPFLYKYPLPGYKDGDSSPIILIPGIFEKWHFLREIGDALSQKGHPIYVVEGLKYNTAEIPASARKLRDFIDEEKLGNVIIVAHSKGGLIGKYLLKFFNSDARVKKLIAIASPFGGSNIAKLIPLKPVKELHPRSKIIQELQEERGVNSRITSIFGTFDNHIWPLSSCYLEGGENIQVDVHGHHRILANKEVLELVLDRTRS